jgi:DUF1365 family protein
MFPQPSVCVGTLRHRRFRPKPHDFTYPLFQVFLDVDRIPELMRVSPLTSYNRWNVASFDDRDHFGDPRQPLRERLAEDASRAGLRLPDGPVFLLTHLRYLGYCFNPVSFFYCYDRRGRLELLLAEVNNTFGDSENYWLSPANEWPAGAMRRYRCPKRMHVSPFMPMELDYTFVFSPPDSRRLFVHMNTIENGQPNFDATLRLTCQPWSARALHRALARFPWMTAKVITAIHWQALRLWSKGLRFYPSPARGVRREITAEVQHAES